MLKGELNIRALPWVDPSTMWLEDMCGYRLFLQKVLEKEFSSGASNLGSNFHLMHNEFWERVEIEKVIEFSVGGRSKDTEAYRYFFETMTETIPPDEITKDENGIRPMDEALSRFVGSYCRWLVRKLREVNIGLEPTKTVIRKYFFPMMRELYLEDEKEKLYGTLDAMYLLPNNGILIMDLKTGRIPKEAKMSTSISRQLHTYAHLVLVNKDSMGLKGLLIKDVEVSVLYVNATNPIEIRRKASNISMKAVFNHRDKVVEIWKSGKYEKPEPHARPFVCRNCPAAVECITPEDAYKYEIYNPNLSYYTDEMKKKYGRLSYGHGEDGNTVYDE